MCDLLAVKLLFGGGGGGGYEIKGGVSCITSISVCFLFMLNW